MDPELIDISKLSQNVRHRILIYVLKKGISSTMLGFSSNYINRVKRGVLRVSDNLVKACLKHITLEEYIQLTGDRLETIDAGTVIRVLKSALRDRNLRYIVIDLVVKEAGEEVRLASRQYRVTEDDLKKFERILAQKAKSTAKAHRIYLHRALNSLNFTLTPDKLSDYILELIESSGEGVARHTAKSLKLFIKEVIKPKEPILGQILYSSFKTIKPKPAQNVIPLTLPQVRGIAGEIEHLGAKAYFALLTETGCRPGALFKLQLEHIDLKERLIKFYEVAAANSATKHHYIGFFSVSTAKWLKEVYLPYRERFIKENENAMRNLGFSEREIREWRKKLIPFKESTIRSEIYRASEKAIGKRIRLYDLRAFFASYMSLKGVPAQVIDILQGRLPPREFHVLAKHYLAFSIKDLREIYDKAGLTVL